MFSRVVELHVYGIQSGAVYTVDVNALVFVDAGLFELQGPLMIQNVIKILSLETVFFNNAIFKVVPDKFRFQEMSNFYLI